MSFFFSPSSSTLRFLKNPMVLGFWRSSESNVAGPS
jgi:hypothetical protein